MNYIDIEPKEILQTATKMKIDVVNLVLRDYAIIRVTLVDSNFRIVQTNELILRGGDYNAWQSDNDLVSIICSRYNYQLN